MEREQAKQAFELHCFQPAVQTWTQEITKQYQADYKKNEAVLIEQLEQYLELLAALQERTGCKPVAVTISVLWSALMVGTPAILLEAYETVPFLSDSILSQKVKAPWLFYGWRNFLEDLEQRTKKQGLSTYIRKPELRGEAIQGARHLLPTYQIMMKTHVDGLNQQSCWSRIQKEGLFCITMGEYMERQVPLVGERDKVDLTFLEPESDVRFGKFEHLIFQEQHFQKLTMSDTAFEHCTFRHVTFTQCSFHDSVWVDCTFEHCVFQESSWMGAKFYGTRWTDCTMEQIWCQVGQSKAVWDIISKGHTGLYDCLLEQTKLISCQWKNIRLRNCQFLHMQSKDSQLNQEMEGQMEPWEDMDESV